MIQVYEYINFLEELADKAHGEEREKLLRIAEYLTEQATKSAGVVQGVADGKRSVHE